MQSDIVSAGEGWAEGGGGACNRWEPDDVFVGNVGRLMYSRVWAADSYLRQLLC